MKKTIEKLSDLMEVYRANGPGYVAVTDGAQAIRDVIYVTRLTYDPSPGIPLPPTPLSLSCRYNNFRGGRTIDGSDDDLQEMLDYYWEHGLTLTHDDDPAVRFSLKHRFSFLLDAYMAIAEGNMHGC